MSPETLQFETFNGMGRFYSWKYILAHLAKRDLHYAAVGLFGRKIVGRTLKQVRSYMRDLTSQEAQAGEIPCAAYPVPENSLSRKA